MTFEMNVLLKTTLILVCVGLLAAVMRRASAASRYAVWALGLLAVLAFPVVTGVLPSIDVPLLPAVETSPAMAVEPPPIATVPILKEAPVPTAAPPRPLPWTLRDWLALGWALGTTLVFTGWVAALVSLHRVTRRSNRLTERGWLDTLASLKHKLGITENVQLRLTERSTPPMTWGIFRHVILLPATARKWSVARRRLVLAHELAHIKRVDGLGQFLAQCVGSIYWFNPLVWYAIRRLQIERERACDDTVLRLGTSATDYADHLLQIARGLRSQFVLTAVCMAQPSQLKSRIMSILNPNTRRQTLSRVAAAALLFLVAVLTLSTATIHVTAMAPLVQFTAAALPLAGATAEAVLIQAPVPGPQASQAIADVRPQCHLRHL